MFGLTIFAQNKDTTFILITNARIFDGVNERLNDGSILIRNNLILEIGQIANVPENTKTINANGNVVSPGFIDAHTHIALIAPFDKLENEYSGVYVGAAGGQVAEDILMRGFTTIRDAGGASIGIQRAIDDGWLDGPRIYSSGAFITQTSGHLDMHDRNEPHHHVGGGHSMAEQIGHFTSVNGEAEMLAAVRENFRQGATQIKLATNGGVSAVYSPLDLDQFTDAELEAAFFTAENFGSYVMVHAYYDKAVARAVNMGAKSIEHGHLITESTIKEMAEKDVFLVVEALMSISDAPPSFTDDQREKYDLIKREFLKMIVIAKKHNLKIAFGSDVFLSQEMYSFQPLEWTARLQFFTPYEIMVQATSNGAELISYSGERDRYKDGKLGVIQEGAYADIVIIKGNPLEDIKLLSSPEQNILVVMKDGVIYKNMLDQK